MKRIGILTFHDVINYGAVLQAYALQRYLRESGHDVQIINYRPPYFIRQYKYSMRLRWNSPLKSLRNFVYGVFWGIRVTLLQKKLFSDFRIAYLKTTQEVFSFEDLSNAFDVIIVGSDQVWNPSITGNCFDPIFWADFLPAIKKISYAASAGDYTFSHEEEIIIKKFLRNFFTISVREDKLAERLLSLATGIPIYSVNDPAFLLPVKCWNELTTQCPVKEKYVACYNKKYDKNIKKIAKWIAHQINATVIYFPSFDAPCIGNHSLKVGPQEFLTWMKHADFIVTNSFHGVVFSIIFNRDFWMVGEQQDPRIKTLLKSVDLETRNIESNIDKLPEYTKINYSLVNARLTEFSQTGKDFLEKALAEV